MSFRDPRGKGRFYNKPKGKQPRKRTLERKEKRKQKKHRGNSFQRQQYAASQASAQAQAVPARKQNELKLSSKKKAVSRAQQEQDPPSDDFFEQYRRPDDASDSMDTEDEEIARLERKLKLKGTNTLANPGMRSYFEEQGGKDFLELMDFVGSVDTSKPSRHNASENSAEEDNDPMSESEASPVNSSDEEVPFNDVPSDDGYEDESDDEEEEEEDEEEEDDDYTSKLKAKKARTEEEVKQSIRDVYGQDVAITRDAKTAPKKYIPPHLRAAALKTGESKEETQIKRQVNALLNRVSEFNLDAIGNGLLECYQQHSRGLVSESLCENIQKTCAAKNQNDFAANVDDEDAHLRQTVKSSPLLMSLGAVITAAHRLVDNSIGSLILEKLSKQLATAIEEQSLPTSTQIILLLCYLYNYQMTFASYMFDVLDLFVHKLSDFNAEMLLLLVTNAGAQLRHDDPVGLRNAIAAIQKSSAEVSENGETSGRASFVLDSLYALKNNSKRNTINTALEPMKNWLKAYCASNKSRGKQLSVGLLEGGEQTVRVGWKDYLAADTTGRWWLIGAAWAGGQERAKASNGASSSSSSGEKSTYREQKLREKESMTVMDAQGDVDLNALAKTHRMSAGLRKSVFCVIMGAQDYMDAFEKLLKLNLTKKQAREIMRVLVHCTLSENTFNMYYALLTNKLCSVNLDHRFTLKLLIFDLFKRFDDYEPEDEEEDKSTEPLTNVQIVNLAHFTVHLTLRQSLPFLFLKALRLGHRQLKGQSLLFLLTYFDALLTAPGSIVTFTEVKMLVSDGLGVSGKKKKKHSEELHILSTALHFFCKKALLPYMKMQPNGTELVGKVQALIKLLHKK